MNKVYTNVKCFRKGKVLMECIIICLSYFSCRNCKQTTRRGVCIVCVINFVKGNKINQSIHKCEYIVKIASRAYLLFIIVCNSRPSQFNCITFGGLRQVINKTLADYVLGFHLNSVTSRNDQTRLDTAKNHTCIYVSDAMIRINLIQVAVHMDLLHENVSDFYFGTCMCHRLLFCYNH